MNRYLILLAGPPATGKTYLMNQIVEVIDVNYRYIVTPDEIKEMYADKYGFDNLNEKANLEKLVWRFYYSALDLYMEAGKKIIISEYPFSEKQYYQLNYLSTIYEYQVITIRLVADFDVLWERRQKRDLKPGRHLSHLMSHYHYGDRVLDLKDADNHITRDEFKNIIDDRDYNNFSLGKLIEFDVTDYNKVDYSELIDRLSKL